MPAATEKREALREEYWPDEIPWTGKSKGWFAVPRTLPLVLGLMASKSLSGNQNPSSVYLELLSRHIDSGVIKMTHEEDHAYAAGYWGPRGQRSWRERMSILESRGFIKSKPLGNRKYGYVLIVHPVAAVERLRQQEKLPPRWWDTFRERQVEVKEPSYSDLVPEESTPKHSKTKTANRAGK